ncbi:hypothetical protein G5V59_12445 [Nocardioides sp. W3-2-3]|uniref:sigma factor n=1 Tax=Nocardioides convexus TaxID=2712224 RepID=UPI00241853E3|nr:sigma factor [Nocardioides convexus]NHA00557.1 hypothetical protein [Nocardioides convexus]
MSPEERKSRTSDLLDRATRETGAAREVLLEQVIVMNIPVARSLASRYRNRGQSQEELEQVACLALTRAVQGFDPERGDDLLVFAVPTILGEPEAALPLGESGRCVRRAGSRRSVRGSRPRRRSSPSRWAGRRRRPSLAAEVDAPVDEVEEALSCGDLAHASSLDEPVSETGSTLAEPAAHRRRGLRAQRGRRPARSRVPQGSSRATAGSCGCASTSR